MTDEPYGTPRRPEVDTPTVMGPSTGHLQGPAPEDPTLPATQDNPPRSDDPERPGPAPARPDGPATAADAPNRADPTPAGSAPAEPTRPGAPSANPPIDDRTQPSATPMWPGSPPAAEPGFSPAAPPIDGGPTIATPIHEPWPGGQAPVPPPMWQPDADGPAPDEPTAAVVDESPTTTGPTVAGWPLDELLPPPPTDLVWRPDSPEPAPPACRPAYYIALGASVVLVVALIAAAALATVTRPTREVAGTAKPGQTIPEITDPGTGAPAPPTAEPQTSPAEHPLSSSTARMADATCALPRFGLADDRQAAFYAAAKTCADDAWRGVLSEAGLEGTVEVVTVTGPVRTQSCGQLTPTSPSTQCDGTVYMTPAYLRDTEKNGRYPGRYFGVFLREYARALQFTSGLTELAANVDGTEPRLAQQATCMAGIASGAMANRGAVDANITGEISQRLSSVDAPPDAKAMLDKGFQGRTLKSCNTW